jgi:hypothetical protein
MSQEAKAVSRKATGMHNWTDRAGKPEIPTPKGGQRGTGFPSNETMKAKERRCKLDASFGRKRSRYEPINDRRVGIGRGATLLRQVDRDERWTWEPCAVKVARTVLRGGECREAPTYPT